MIVLATTNKHKVKEIAAVLSDLSWRQVDPSFNVEEGKESLVTNAILKATAARALVDSQDIILGEDTGLFVDALGGAPGVVSSRYAGDNVSFDENIKKLLQDLESVSREHREATFITIAALYFPDGKLIVSCGSLRGEILSEERGAKGFGYDPVFYVPDYQKTFAELSFEEKTKISHRGKAIRALLPYLGAV